MNEKIITNLSVTDHVTLVTLNNVPNNINIVADIFSDVAKENINIDMISQTAPYRSKINISFTISDCDIVKVINTLGKHKKMIPKLHMEINSNNSKLSIYGEAMRNTSGIAAKLFALLSKDNIEVKLVTTSEVDISYLINEKDVEPAIRSVRNEFDL